MNRKSVPSFLSASLRKKVQFYHLDPMEVVWHGNYASFFEEVRCELLDKLDYNYNQMRASGYSWPVVDMRIKFIRPLIFAQEVILTADIVEYENRLKINYLISHAETGERLTKGHTIQVAIDMASMEMCFESPQILFDKIKAVQCPQG